MKLRTSKTCIAAMLAFAAVGATSAMAQSVVLQGGGSSLVGPSIQQEIVQFGANPDSLTYFIDSSGVGQTAFLGNDPAAFEPSFTITGTIDFANSDAALSASQITAYDTAPGLGATEGPLIQIPYITTPITVAYVNGPTASTDTLKGPQTTPGQTNSLALNDNDLCGIFSGKLTTWNAVINPDTGTTFSSSAPIKVVYRSDNSGTSDLLTRHLAQVCTTGASGNSNVSFVETQAFASNFPGSTPPSNFIGESGSGGIQNELVALGKATTAAVAYISPDWTNTFLAPKSSSAAADLAVASLVNSFLSNSPLGTADVAPLAANATLALGSVTPPATASAAADQTQWVPDAANPTTGYPISGTSQIIVSECYATANAATSVVSFLNDHYTNATYTSIIRGNGFDTVPAAYAMAIGNDFLTNNSGFGLNISNGGHVGDCHTFAGR
jgi:phosphate transport system substrate-binding protein